MYDIGDATWPRARHMPIPMQSRIFIVLEQIEQLRDGLASFVALLENIVSEGDRMSPQPDGLGFAVGALRIFVRNLDELDHGLEGSDADSIVHAALMTHADLRIMTEGDFSWSLLWSRSDEREKLRIITSDLINDRELIARTADLAAELAGRR